MTSFRQSENVIVLKD